MDSALDLGAYDLPPFFIKWNSRSVSCSHLAMNKMALVLKQGLISGGMWVVSSGHLASYLTHSTGRFPEVEPYLGLYSDLEVGFGYLGVAIVEYDETAFEVPLIEKQQAKRRRVAE